jgi:hypothetical protein
VRGQEQVLPDRAVEGGEFDQSVELHLSQGSRGFGEQPCDRDDVEAESTHGGILALAFGDALCCDQGIHPPTTDLVGPGQDPQSGQRADPCSTSRTESRQGVGIRGVDVREEVDHGVDVRRPILREEDGFGRRAHPGRKGGQPWGVDESQLLEGRGGPLDVNALNVLRVESRVVPRQ